MASGRVSEARRRNMQAIKGKNTTPELTVRRFLHAAGFRFRLHDGRLPGRPDIVLKRFRTVVFVHGCFWHHHGCANSVWPKTRSEFWRAKLGGNRRRDRVVQRGLERLGWRVLTVWECEADSATVRSHLVRALRRSTVVARARMVRPAHKR